MKKWKMSRVGIKIVIKFTTMCFAIFILTLIVSYIILIPPLKEQTVKTAKDINRQIMQQADILFSNIKNYTETIAYDSGYRTAYQNYANKNSEKYYYRVCQNLNRLAGMNNKVRNIIIESQDGKQRFTSIVQINDMDLKLLESNWYIKLHESKYADGFSEGYLIKEEGGFSSEIYTAAYCKNFYMFGKWFTVTVFFKCNYILDFSKLLVSNMLDNYMWTDLNYKPFFLKKDDNWSGFIKEHMENTEHTDISFFWKNNGYNFVQFSEESNWLFVSYVSGKNIKKDYRPYFWMIIYIFSTLFLCIIFITPFIIIPITNPISQLKNVMLKVSNGELDVMPTVQTDDEIGDLSIYFNNMVYDLKISINKLLEKEEMEHRMKYNLLISQLDPHFIYNTMNSINILARRGKCEDIIAVNTALIKILQDRLRVKKMDVFDTVEQEVNMVKQYIIIHNYRYQGDVKFIWDIDEELYNFKIPKSIIQPLVENSLYHGMFDENGNEINGTIKISIKMENTNIIIRVLDDGIGIEPAKLKELNSSDSIEALNSGGKHIGLANLRARLSYLYDTKNCIFIDSEPQQGTCVTVKIKRVDT